MLADKCSGNCDKAIFFVKETISNGWSRAVLLNFIDTDLYDRQGKAVSNFNLILPVEESDLAQEMTKDPYNFDFLTLTRKYNERQLKKIDRNQEIRETVREYYSEATKEKGGELASSVCSCASSCIPEDFKAIVSELPDEIVA